MHVKSITFEDFVNYKKPSMFIACPYCTFKCNKDAGKQVCQNESLASAVAHNVSVFDIYKAYIDNPITKSVVLGGLEPLESWEDVQDLVEVFRQNLCCDDIVIYTGYNEEEILDKIDWLSQFPNIVMKFGRYIPSNKKHYDEVLGIYLASDNQYGRRIS